MRLTTRHLINPGLWAGVLLVLVVVFRFPTGEVRLSFTILAELGVVLLLGLLISQRVNRWWGFFLVLSAFSSVHPLYTRHSFLAFHAVVIGSIWYYLVATEVNFIGVTAIYDAMCAIALTHVAFLVMQALGYDPLFVAKTGGTVPVGLMANRNECSALLAMCMPAFLRREWIWGLTIIGVGLVLTRTSMGFLSAGAGLFFYAWYFTPRMMRPLLIVGVLGGVTGFFLVIDTPGFERWEAWKQGFSLWLQHPWFGAGLGHWKVVSAKHIHTSVGYFQTAHNEYLQGLFEMGVLFPVIVGGYLYGVWRRWRNRALDPIPMVAVIVVAVNSIGNFPFHIGVTALVAVTWMAIFEINLGVLSYG